MTRRRHKNNQDLMRENLIRIRQNYRTGETTIDLRQQEFSREELKDVALETSPSDTSVCEGDSMNEINPIFCSSLGDHDHEPEPDDKKVRFDQQTEIHTRKEKIKRTLP